MSLASLPMGVRKWLSRLWYTVVGLVLLATVGYGVYDATHRVWGVALVLGAILAAALLVRYCLKPSPTSRPFLEDDPTDELYAWAGERTIIVILREPDGGPVSEIWVLSTQAMCSGPAARESGDVPAYVTLNTGP